MEDKGMPKTGDAGSRIEGVRHTVSIKPAIPPEERHKVEHTLTALGYRVTGGGTCSDMSESDISFYRN